MLVFGFGDSQKRSVELRTEGRDAGMISGGMGSDGCKGEVHVLILILPIIKASAVYIMVVRL